MKNFRVPLHLAGIRTRHGLLLLKVYPLDNVIDDTGFGD